MKPCLYKQIVKNVGHDDLKSEVAKRYTSVGQILEDLNILMSSKDLDVDKVKKVVKRTSIPWPIESSSPYSELLKKAIMAKIK